jgi:hypothetical protein
VPIRGGNWNNGADAGLNELVWNNVFGKEEEKINQLEVFAEKIYLELLQNASQTEKADTGKACLNDCFRSTPSPHTIYYIEGE